MSVLLLTLGLLAQPNTGDAPPAVAPETPPATEAPAPDSAPADAPAETPGDTPDAAAPAETPAGEATPVPEATEPGAGDAPAEPVADEAGAEAQPTEGVETLEAGGADSAAETPVEGAPAGEPAADTSAAEPAADTPADAPADAPAEMPAGDAPTAEATPAIEELEAAPAEGAAAAEEAAAEGAEAPAEEGGGLTDPEWVRVAGSYEAVGTKAERTFSVSGYLMYRTLMVTDEQPANGMSVWGVVRGNVHLFEGAKVWARMAFEQRMVAEIGESGFLFQDLRLGFDYSHQLAFDWLPTENAWLKERNLQFLHRGTVFMPTSRLSQNQDLHLSLRAREIVRMNIIAGLDFSLDNFLQLYFREYAEQAGLKGGMNSQFAAYISPALEYTFDELGPIPGEILVGANIYWWWNKDYASGQDAAPASDQYGSVPATSDLADRIDALYAESNGPRGEENSWSLETGWGFWVDYTPVPYFTLEMSVEHGFPWLNNGVHPTTDSYESVWTGFAHRDYTEFVVRLIGRY